VQQALLHEVVGIESRKCSAAGEKVIDKQCDEGDLPIGEFAWR
jgi:hypothetical protein